MAKECLGFAPDRQPQPGSAEGALAARLIQRVEEVFKNDPARIAHALRVFQFAKELVREEGGDPRVVLCASLLLATVGREALCLDGAPGEPASQPETIAAEKVLREMGLDEVALSRVLHIARSCHENLEDSDDLELKIVCDSERLASIVETPLSGSADELRHAINARLRTAAGRNKACSLSHS